LADGIVEADAFGPVSNRLHRRGGPRHLGSCSRASRPRRRPRPAAQAPWRGWASSWHGW